LGWDGTNWSGIYSALGKFTLTDREHFCLGWVFSQFRSGRFKESRNFINIPGQEEFIQ
jgi:hypothetical protein